MPSLEDLKNLVDSAGYLPYLIIFVWTLLEGETIVILAGYFARDGSPNLGLVMLAAFCGSLTSDQVIFFLGRRHGRAFVAKRPWLLLKAQKVFEVLHRHQNWLIVGFRFLYGLRNITPFALGMSEVKARKFVILNVIGAIVWAISFACAGFFFGKLMDNPLFKKVEHYVLIGIVSAVVVIWLVRMITGRKKLKKLKEKVRTEGLHLTPELEHIIHPEAPATPAGPDSNSPDNP